MSVDEQSPGESERPRENDSRLAKQLRPSAASTTPRDLWGIAAIERSTVVADPFFMNVASSLIDWFVANAVIVLFVSVTATVLAELAFKWLRGKDLDVSGTTTSISAGIAYISAKGVVSKVLMFAVAMWVYNNHRIFDLDATSPLVWLTMFVCRDFVYYWIHRAEHQVSVLWASHMVHHSSEQFTFTTAVRMPWMEALYKPVLALWAPLLGFHPAVFAAMGALVLVVGQFQHTEMMKKRSVLDSIFVTPSAHRVHHGSNAEYLDKNFGSMLIVWDRLFGTYEPEAAPVVYGLTGEKSVSDPKEALVGGYRTLAAEVRGTGVKAGARHLLSAPV